MSDEYSAFAEVYDAWQRVHGPEYSQMVAARVNSRLDRWAGRPGVLIDLACGTGTHALLQAARGVRVIGVDLSAAMLRQARRKAAGAGLPVEFVRADMRDFDIEKPVDAVTCLYAALNHLPDTDDLTATFRRVADHLRPGGVLVFDVNTRQGFEALWRRPAVDRGDGFTVRRSYETDADGLWTTMHLNIEQVVAGELRRERDALRARWFTSVGIRAALESAGLRVVDATPFNPFPEVPVKGIKQLWTALRPD